MSKVDERYQRGKIYCLRSHQTDLVYIGSTVQGLAERIGGHRKDYKVWLKHTNHYVSSFELIKYDDAYIELIENYPCNTKSELLRREGEIIRETKNCCNRRIAGRTVAEWFFDNKEKMTEYNTKYYQKNKEKHAERGAKWYQENKEKVAECGAKWYQENKEKLSEKVQCDCGSEVTKKCLTRHKRTKKHQSYLESLIEA